MVKIQRGNINNGSFYTYRQDSFGITERDNIRTQWKMEICPSIEISAKKFIEEGRFIGGFTVPDHPKRDLYQWCQVMMKS